MAPLENLVNFEFHLFFGWRWWYYDIRFGSNLGINHGKHATYIVVATFNPHAFGPSLGKTIIDIEIDEIGFEISIMQPSKKRKAKWQVQRNS
jgi:hypothetical protein